MNGDEGSGLTTAYLYHPRGFRRLVGASSEDLSNWEDPDRSKKVGIPVMETHNGVDRVNELKELFAKKANCGYDWELANYALSLAAQLLPNMGVFINDQSNNRRLHEHSWEFIVDICEFINTGRCRMHPLNRFELMDDFPAARAIDNDRRPPTVQCHHRGTMGYLTQLLSHEGGLEYLVDVLWILFGGPRVVPH